MPLLDLIVFLMLSAGHTLLTMSYLEMQPISH